MTYLDYDADSVGKHFFQFDGAGFLNHNMDFVRAEIEGRVAHGVLIVPRASMRDGERLLVVDGQSRLREREGEILRIDRDDVLVRTKLEPGDRVVVSPLQVVVDGMRVRPQPTSLAGRS